MPKRKSSSPSGKAVTVVMLIAALGVGVFAAYVQMTPNARRVPDSLRRPERNEDTATTREPAKVNHRGPDVDVVAKPSLYLATASGDKVELTPLEAKVPNGTDPIVFTANATLKSLKIGEAKVIGVQVKDRIALIDFTPSLEDGLGSMEEATLVKAMQMTIGQFSDVDGFQFIVDGQALDTLGHFELDTPVPVIRPGKSEPESVPSTPSEDPASTAPR